MLVNNLLFATTPLAIVVFDLFRTESVRIDRNMGKSAAPKISIDHFGASDLKPSRADNNGLVYF